MDELLGRIAQHDCAAFDAFYRAGFPLVFRAVLAVLNDHAQSEEVTQEVFFEVWCTAARYQHSRGDAKRWIVTIARRRAIDRVRNAQAARARDHNAAGELGGATAPDAADEAQHSLDRAAVREVLDNLDDQQRELLVWAYGHGISCREIAEHLDVPVTTVKSRVRRALAELRSRFHNQPATR